MNIKRKQLLKIESQTGKVEVTLERGKEKARCGAAHLAGLIEELSNQASESDAITAVNP